MVPAHDENEGEQLVGKVMNMLDEEKTQREKPQKIRSEVHQNE